MSAKHLPPDGHLALNFKPELNCPLQLPHLNGFKAIEIARHSTETADEDSLDQLLRDCESAKGSLNG